MTEFESAPADPASSDPVSIESTFAESSVTPVVEPAVLPSIDQDEELALEPRLSRTDSQ